MARGTLRCGLILIFGLSSIASAALDLVSRVGTRRSARPHAHTARTPTHPPARRIPGAGGDARTKRWTVVEWTSHIRSCSSHLSSDYALSERHYRLSSEAERASEFVVSRVYASLSTADNQFIYRLGRGRTEKNMMSEYRVPVVTALTACTRSELWTVASPSERSIRWMWPSNMPSRWPPP